jgi:hypothetical protein
MRQLTAEVVPYGPVRPSSTPRPVRPSTEVQRELDGAEHRVLCVVPALVGIGAAVLARQRVTAEISPNELARDVCFVRGCERTAAEWHTPG